MPHTNSRFEGKQGFGDGVAIFGPNDIDALAAADCVLTRTAAGNYCYAVGNTKTVTFGLNLGKLLQRTGLVNYQEQFGTAAGVAGPTAVANTTDPVATPYPYIPPFPGAGVNLIPQAGFVPKGVKIMGFKVAYFVKTADATALTCRVDKTVYADGVAVAVTAVLASAANGLVATFAATPKVKTVLLATAEQIYRVTDLSALTFEIGVQTPGGGTFELEKIEVNYHFNFN